MIRLIIFLLFSLISSWTFGQNVQIIEQNKDYKTTDTCISFDYVYKGLELSNKPKVALLKGFCSKSGDYSLLKLFHSLWDEANKLGANSYRIDSFINNKSDTIFLVLSVFNLTEVELSKNLDFYPKNMVYVIGNLNTKKQIGNIYKINNKKCMLLPLEYFSYQNKVNEETTVSVGGITGAKVWIKGKENRMPTYLSLTGFGVEPGFNGQIGLKINTGRIYPVELNYGQFLAHILNERK